VSSHADGEKGGLPAPDQHPGEPMKAFALTTVHNEAFFLPRWIAYYATQLGAENLFILDHGSTDLSTANCRGVNVIRVPRVNYDEGKRTDSLSDLHTALLNYYDCGFLMDADEFIVANPEKYKNLQDFVERKDYRSLVAVGLELLHIPDTEPDFLFHLPILAQRRTVFFNSKVCKHCFARQPTRFGGGLHTSTNPIEFDPDLFLFHLKHFDYPWRIIRQRVTRGWEYGADFGEHARWGDEKVKDFVDSLIDTYTYNVEPGFDFSAEIEDAMSRAKPFLHDGKTFYEIDPYGFFGERARKVPNSFSQLF
jgi:hypothetical protein